MNIQHKELREKQLSVILMTHNEELHLSTALQSIAPLDPDIFIVDSGSTDGTIDLARAAGAAVFFHEWENYERQLNWALDHLPIRSPWVMRLDADEWLTPELADELSEVLPSLSQGVTGLECKRRLYFWGRWIRHGGVYPLWLLRIWRTGTGRCEKQWMDEHMVLSRGSIVRLKHDFIDENHKGLTFWTEKHNRYADREIQDLIKLVQRIRMERPAGQAGRRRWAKERIYTRLPLFWRALMYWFFRYVILSGFLDGRPGLVYHFLQACWYRFLVDAKLYELNQRCAERQLRIVPTQLQANRELHRSITDDSYLSISTGGGLNQRGTE